MSIGGSSIFPDALPDNPLQYTESNQAHSKGSKRQPNEIHLPERGEVMMERTRVQLKSFAAWQIEKFLLDALQEKLVG